MALLAESPSIRGMLDQQAELEQARWSADEEFRRTVAPEFARHIEGLSPGGFGSTLEAARCRSIGT